LEIENQTLNDAIVAASPPQDSGTPLSFRNGILNFETVLTNVGIDELRSLSDDEIKKLEEIIELIEQRIEDYQRLKS